MMETLSSVGKYFWVKTIGALVAVAGFEFFVIDNDLKKVLYGLFLIIIIDSLTGVYAAYRMKRLASWRMGQPMARKVSLYAIAILSAAVLSSTSKYFAWFPEYLGIYFIISEVLSVFEKLALLGVPIPTGIVKRVNEIFKQYAEGKPAAIAEIFNKEK